MNNLVFDRVESVVKMAKKKQIKNEMDRLKHTEKKRRRLEKALATSAAIRSELEKKKQRKKEEQEKLDKETAAIAEAVALQVLLGEDASETCHGVFSKDNLNGTQDRPALGKFSRSRKGENLPCWGRPIFPLGRIGWPCSVNRSKFLWGVFGEEWTLSRGNCGGCFYEPEGNYSIWACPEFPAAVLTAEDCPSLQITGALADCAPNCLWGYSVPPSSSLGYSEISA